MFLDIRFPDGPRYALIDGTIRMMAGVTPAHARVGGNILGYLYPRLRGTGCRPYNSDMGVRVDDTNLRYPDVTVFCGNPAAPEREMERAYPDPVVIVEVLSPSTSANDEGDKLRLYRALPSVDTIVFVDPQAETSRVVQRLGPTAWRDDLFAQPHDVALPAIGVTIPHAEIFARD
ncbi:Uma2 family endonuclease [Sphingomonas sp. CLY1604]|uniref:Uma2 family endonuclease n=1 Tax=Sphingomonas sp. CLY1604 TaxID=3457786 RepID=UPI003FD8D312